MSNPELCPAKGEAQLLGRSRLRAVISASFVNVYSFSHRLLHKALHPASASNVFCTLGEGGERYA